MSEEITGSCHCKAIKWTFESEVKSATTCNCSMCSRMGAIWVYGSENINASATGPSKFYKRADGDGDIEFHFCPSCGCNTHYRGAIPDEDGTTRLAVNIRCADDPDKLMSVPVRHFEGRDTFKRLPDDDRCVKDQWF